MVSIKYVTFTFASRQRLSKSEKCLRRYLGGGGKSSPSAYCRRFSVSLSLLSLIMFCYVTSSVSSLIGRKCFITQRQTGRWNSRLNIHTVNVSRTCTLQNICLRHLLYMCVNFLACRMLHHKLWSFSMTKDEAALLRTAVTQPFGPQHCVYHTCRIRQRCHYCCTCPSLQEPLLSTTYSNPSGASFVGCKGIS
jgi:hypothetical protein